MKGLSWVILTFVSFFIFSSGASAEVVGNVRAPSSFSNDYAISGWACERGSTKSIDVHIYLGGPTGSGTLLKGVTANRSSEKAVADACRSNGSAYRFSVPISYSEAQKHKGKAIYAYGISRPGSPNPLLNQSGNYRIPTPPEAKVIGQIEGVSKSNGKYFVTGWSCQIGEPKPIKTHLYAGGAVGSGEVVRSVTANLASESRVSDACYTKARNYRFKIPVESGDIIEFVNQKIYVHGISRNGSANLLLNKSGTYRFPGESSISALVKHSGSGDVEIKHGLSVVIDQSADFGLMNVRGKLFCGSGGDYQIKTDGILVEGSSAEFSCGSEQSPYQGSLSIVLTGNRDLSTISSSNMPLGGKAVVAYNGGTISLHGKSGKEGYARLGQTAEKNDTSIYLSQAVSWEKGDSIVIASSSFDPHDAEKFVITDISHTGRRVFLDRPVDKVHWGKFKRYSNGKGKEWVLDQRAEVTNLSRNIKILSADDTYTRDQQNPIGAHMMVMGGGSKAFVDNVEFHRVGQIGIAGRYPFHWHLMGNVDGQYIKNSSIHESYHRCITIHGTNRSLVKRNTCYNHKGHGFFMENGNEIENRIEDNIGILSKKMPKEKAILISDSASPSPLRYAAPATFWITNPTNYVVNNVAAGSEGTGFWMSFKQAMQCNSSGCTHRSGSGNVFPASAKTLRFDGNIAHSSLVGINHDGAHDGSPINGGDQNRTIQSSRYDPQEYPTFKDLVAYKNLNSGLYYRGSRAVYENAVLADNGASAFFAYDQELVDTLIVGWSESLTQDEVTYYFRNTNWTGYHRPMSGVRIYDGPFYLDGVHFADFPITEKRALNKEEKSRDITPTAIMLMGGSAKYVNQTKNITFNPSSIARKVDMRESDGNSYAKSWGDSYSSALLDKDGSLLGEPNNLIRPLIDINEDQNCQRGNEFGEISLLKCNYEISYLHFFGTNHVPFKVQRISKNNDVVVHDQNTSGGKHYNKFSMIMNRGYEYHVRNLNHGNPNGLKIRYSANTTDDISPVVILIDVGQCELEGARRASSKGNLISSSSAAYWSEYGNLYIKLKGDREPKMREDVAHARKEYKLEC